MISEAFVKLTVSKCRKVSATIRLIRAEAEVEDFLRRNMRAKTYHCSVARNPENELAKQVRDISGDPRTCYVLYV